MKLNSKIKQFLDVYKGPGRNFWDYVSEGYHIITWWETINWYSNNEPEFNLTYQQKRQLFLDLVEYYMKKGWLKFQNGDVGIEPRRWLDENGMYTADTTKNIYWDGENSSVEETLSFLDKHMPKGDEEGFDEETWLLTFFYASVPLASYWYDGNDPEYPEAGWVHSD